MGPPTSAARVAASAPASMREAVLSPLLCASPLTLHTMVLKPALLLALLAAASAAAAAATTTPIVWGFPHAPRPRLTLAPGDSLSFEWTAEHGVYLIPAKKAGGTPSCDDGAGFKDAGLTLARAPARKDYGPVAGSMTWTATTPGTYAFADPVASNCGAGMLLIVDVKAPAAAAAVAGAAAPDAVVAASPAPAPAAELQQPLAQARRGPKPPPNRPSPAERRASAARAERDGGAVLG